MVNLRKLQEDAKGMTLLYVEDDEGIVSVFSEILRIIFPSVIVAKNGSEGLELFKKHHTDIIMTDIYMPIMDGLEMAKAIRSLHQKVPIIVTSAYSQPDEFLRSIEVGIDEYVVKPFTKDRLFDAIAKVLNHLLSARRLKEYHSLIENILTHVIDGIIVTDTSTTITLANPALCKMMGYEPHELIGSKPSCYKSDAHDDAFYDAMWCDIHKKGEWRGEVINRKKDGTLIVLESVIVSQYNEEGEVIAYIGTCRDITQHKQTINEAHYLAMHDALTGVYNRQYFDKMEIEYTAEYSVMMIDIDGFKQINDQYGHAMGDAVLVKIAQGIESIVRKSDIIIRYGGDEFMVILTHLTADDMIAKISQRMLDFAENLNEEMVNNIKIGLSIGVCVSKPGYTLNELYEQADKAMYRIKKEGKNNFSIVTP